ncbi:hypothetical protein BN2537_3367 [Streptomyces venezuelae]|nr:hypothetical protein BN2537_3367 [Streptomyces venezuelae]
MPLRTWSRPCLISNHCRAGSEPDEPGVTARWSSSLLWGQRSR